MCAGYLLLDLRLDKLDTILGFLISVILMESIVAPKASQGVVCYTQFEDFLWHGLSLPQLFIPLAVLTSVM